MGPVVASRTLPTGPKQAVRHEEGEEEEGEGKKGGRKERMMIRIMASWALGVCCGDGFFEDS